MPTYVYRKRDGEKGCRHCAVQFEVVQRMAEDALKTCPECGGAVQRVIVPVGIVLDIQPQVAEDGTITLAVNPSVSEVVSVAIYQAATTCKPAAQKIPTISDQTLVS